VSGRACKTGGTCIFTAVTVQATVSVFTGRPACRQPCQCLLAGLPAGNRVSVYWQACLQATVSVFTGRCACKQPCQCLLAGLPASNRVSVYWQACLQATVSVFTVYWQACLQATVSVFTGRPACRQPCQCLLAGLPAGNRVSVYCLLAGLPAGNRVSVSFTKQSKNGFLTPQKRHIALTNVNLVRSAVSNFTLIFAEVWDYSP